MPKTQSLMIWRLCRAMMTFLPSKPAKAERLFDHMELGVAEITGKLLKHAETIPCCYRRQLTINFRIYAGAIFCDCIHCHRITTG